MFLIDKKEFELEFVKRSKFDSRGKRLIENRSIWY
jgi:hypothetical protein